MAGRKPTRTTRTPSAEYPCTRCGRKIRSLEEARRPCPTPGDPYDRPSYSGPPAGHSLHPLHYLELQVANATRRNGPARGANENMCPDCASAPRANPGRECGDCGSWVCAHTSVEKRGAVQCLPCRNGTDCGCGAGGGCSCLFAFGECRCERILANRGMTAGPELCGLRGARSRCEEALGACPACGRESFCKTHGCLGDREDGSGCDYKFSPPRSNGSRRGRPSLREIERRAASLSKVRRNPLELEAIEAMADGRDPSGRREDDYPGWSDGDFEELLAIYRNGRRSR